MPRTARIASKSGISHVMFRGNELRDIFIDDEDRMRFIQSLTDKTKSENFRVYAYCLMDNHVHLLIEGNFEKLGHLVKRINTSYVYYFNKKYGRIGHLFHDRYKSEPVETDAYLFEVIRYIHNNPVKACIAKSPGEYEWSSYCMYINAGRDDSRFVETDYILGMYSTDKEKAIILFTEYSKNKFELSVLDLKEDNDKKEKLIKGRGETQKYVEEYLDKKGIKLKDLKLKAYTGVRNELIGELKSKSDQSVRDIALILDLNRGVVQRV